MKRRLISLFCGCGGLDEGFAQAWFQTGLAYDCDASALNSFARNHGVRSPRSANRTIVLQTDLSRLEPSDIIATWMHNETEAPVGIIGGPPCQAFSVSNVRPKRNDPRARLVSHYGEVIEALATTLAPAFFVFENVIGLTRATHRSALADFINRTGRAGYRTFEARLDAQHFAVAQSRQRIFVVGIHRDQGLQSFLFPSGSLTPTVTVRDAIGHLPEPLLFKDADNAASEFHPNHWAMTPRSKKFSSGELRAGTIRGRSFRVLPWDGVSWTVAYGHREVHVHPTGTRRLSVLEAMLLQGFPFSYVLEGTLSSQIEQVSNAVPPPVAQSIAEAIVAQLPMPGPDAADTANAHLSRNGHVEQAGRIGVQVAAPRSTRE